MNRLYSFIAACVGIGLFPVALVLSLFGRSWLLSKYTPPQPVHDRGSRRVWIHAASVGESGIAFSLARALKRMFPDVVVVVSTMTEAGLGKINGMNTGSGSKMVDSAFLAPLDSPLVTGQFIDAVKPTTCVIVETELWPSFIHAMAIRKIPVVIVNGRISRKAFRRYMMIRPLVRTVVGELSLVCVQTRTFLRRFEMLGIPLDRLEVFGNMKFDNLPTPVVGSLAARRRELGVPAQAFVFVVGSTRPGEEQIVLNAFLRVQGSIPEAVMVLAPRHIDRVPEVKSVLATVGLSFSTRTSGEKLDETGGKLLLLDTIGELTDYMACADVVFVGGSLSNYGGHNPLEPAGLGVPVLFGPFMEQNGAKELLMEDAAVVVKDENELSEKLLLLYRDKTERLRMGEAGLRTVARFRGALDRTIRCMVERGVL